MLEALKLEFMRNAVFAGILVSIACGVIGSYVVVKRIVFISGGISHTVFGGLGIAYYLGINPMYGAIVFSILAALGIGTVHIKARQREDTIIGAIWAIGMAIGLIFIALTPGYAIDLMSYLFGNILIVSREDVYLTAALDIFIILTVIFLYKEFLAVCFDEEFARIEGIAVEAVYLILLCLTALAIVILIRVVGIILVIALLTLPAAVASHYARTLKGTMFLSSLLSIAFTLSGLALSYWLSNKSNVNLPSGATIIMLAGATYIVSLLVRPLFVIVRRAFQK